MGRTKTAAAMKNITATLYLPRYLEQYLRHHYGSPVRFPARSMENELLRRLTTRPPSQGTAAPAPDESSARLTPIGVVLPDDDLHRPEYYSYLGRTARRRLSLALEATFRVHLWSDCLPLIVCGNVNRGIDEWCCANGISLDSREAVRQKFYRLRRSYASMGIKIGRMREKSLPR